MKRCLSCDNDTAMSTCEHCGSGYTTDIFTCIGCKNGHYKWSKHDTKFGSFCDTCYSDFLNGDFVFCGNDMEMGAKRKMRENIINVSKEYNNRMIESMRIRTAPKTNVCAIKNKLSHE